MTLSKRIVLLLSIAAVGLLGFLVNSPALVQNLWICDFDEVGERNAGHGYTELTFRADVFNFGFKKMTNVQATVRSRSDKIVVVDGSLSFGDVPAGKKVTSLDTFTIRQHGKHFVRWDDLAWNVTGTSVDQPPVANAGPDKTASVGSSVMLDGSRSSDPDGDCLTFHWSFVSVPAGSKAVLSGATRVRPTFIVDRPGNYVIQLVVNDGKMDSAPDTITVSTGNTAPVADAGPDQTVYVGDRVTLDGSKSSDANGDSLGFNWTFKSRPSGSNASFSSPSDVKPTFQVDKPGTYVAQLIVNDGNVNSAPATVTITTQNSKPVANAGADQTVFVGSTATLDGSRSSDVDGDLLTFKWGPDDHPRRERRRPFQPRGCQADLPGR